MRLSLINMPFVGISRPSLGLTQLQSVIRARFKDEIDVEVLYLNIDFAAFLGEALYNSICYTHQIAGLGDWFFRQAAFPDLPPNTDEYFAEYFSADTAANRNLRRVLSDKRELLVPYLNRLVDQYRLDHTQIVGFTSTFCQNSASFAMARVLKTRQPEIVTLMGGANCETTMGMEISRLVTDLDFVFSGSALVSLPTFLRNYINGDIKACGSIHGVFSKHAHDAESSSTQATLPIATTARGEDISIDTTISLDYEEFINKLAQQFPHVPPVLLFETSRGCWWGEKAHCTFCGLNGDSMAYRAMRPANAIAQIDRLFTLYSETCSFFECVDNILPKHYLKEVLPLLNRPANTQLFYEVKADLHDSEVETLARTGVTVIQPGIESLSTPTLRLMRKGMTAFQNISFLMSCRMHGVLPVWNLLVGFPGEDEEMYKKYLEDLPRLTHLFPPRGIFPISFDRYSPYHTRPDNFKLKLGPLRYYGLTYPFPPNSLDRFAYYFSDLDNDSSYRRVMMRCLPTVREKVKAWLSLWFGSHHWSHTKSYDGPKLYCKQTDDSWVICDSRSGTPADYVVTSRTVGLLKALVKPKTLSALQREIAASAADIAEEVQSLNAKGLLFGEGDHYLSLVHLSEPKAKVQWFPW